MSKHPARYAVTYGLTGCYMPDSHGGAVTRSNWGARGGQFPRAYRSATIYVSEYR